MKILHLYYDIMNLYGEYANVSALERIIENSGENAEIDRLTLGDNADINSYDFIYIGSGTEDNQKLVLKDFAKYKESLAQFIDSNKPVLFTGNSFEMLGSTITDCDGNVYEGLGLFDFKVVEQNKRRVTADIVYTADFLEKPIVGFVNKCSEIEGIDKPLFQVKNGIGDNSNSKCEGIRSNNFFGTHVTGPVLIKNPHFLVYIAQLISKNTSGFSVSAEHLQNETAAYEVTLRELNKRYAQ